MQWKVDDDVDPDYQKLPNLKISCPIWKFIQNFA